MIRLQQTALLCLTCPNIKHRSERGWPASTLAFFTMDQMIASWGVSSTAAGAGSTPGCPGSSLRSVPPAPLQTPLQPSTPALAGHPQGTCWPFPCPDTHFPGTMRWSRGSLPVVSASLLLWGQMNVPGSLPQASKLQEPGSGYSPHGPPAPVRLCSPETRAFLIFGP